MTGSISPTTSIAVNGTVTGQSGHPAPTGSVTIFSSGLTVSTVNLTPGSSDVSTFSVTLNSQVLFQGANFVTLQYSGDTTYAGSAFTLNSGGPISNPLSDFSMVPQTTIVPVTAGSSGTMTIDLASVNGFTGTVNLTCTAAPGVSCSMPSSVGLSNGGDATAMLTVNAESSTANGNYNVAITGTDAATGKFIHTLAIEADVTGSSAGAQSIALSNSGSITIATPGATGNTSTITVTPLGGFTGTVDLSCSVSGPSGPTSAATCALTPPSVNISGAALTSTLAVTSTSSTPIGTYTVTVTGKSGTRSATTKVTASIGTPSYTLKNSGNITIKKGATTGNTATITVTPANGFTGTVDLSCVVTPPSGANDPATCALNPQSVTISSGAQTSTLTVSTTAATSMNQPEKLFWPSTGGAVLALVFLFGVPRRRRNWLAMIGLLAFFVSLAATGCGGGVAPLGNGTGPTGGTSNPGTTSGTYTVTVTGTSGSMSQSTNVTVTVQ